MVETVDGKQMQEVQGGSSYQACNDLRLHFGLGVRQTIQSLVVRWPAGKTQHFEGVAANHRYILKEGESLTLRR